MTVHNLFALLLISLFLLSQIHIISADVDCCLSQYNSFGIDCQSGLEENGIRYNCIKVYSSCPYCSLSSNVSTSSSCSQCCVISDHSCPNNYTSTISTWVIIFVVLMITIFCCALVFISAEQTRVKAGISFQDAYFLPIPEVKPELNYNEEDYEIPPDQPTAIARMQSSLDIPIAEPTETTPLISRY